MIIAFFITLTIATIFELGSIWYVIRKWKKVPKVGEAKLADLDKIDLSKILHDIKETFTNKKSEIMVLLAQKGYIKFRRNDDGQLFIDKVKDFDDEEEYGRDILDNIFSEDVTYYGAEDAIMSYETVPWNKAKTRFVATIEKIIEKLSSPENRNRERRYDRAEGDHKIAHKAIIMDWVVGIIPFAIASAYEEKTSVALTVVSSYILIGLVYLVFKALSASASGIMKVITSGQFDTYHPGIRIFITIIAFCLVAALYIGAGVSALFMASFLVVMPWTGPPEINFCAWFEVLLIAVTLILWRMESRRKKKEDRKPNQGYPTHIVKVQNVLSKENAYKLITNKEEYDRVMPLAYMYGKTDELEKLTILNKNEKPEWYEGNDWTDMKELMKELEK